MGKIQVTFHLQTCKDVNWQMYPFPFESSKVLAKINTEKQRFIVPCSGRTLPVPHLGPPTAPRRTASAALAQARESSGRGFPVASMAQPPMSLCWKSISRAVAFSTTLRILIASAVTSGPTPSPANTQMVFFVMTVLGSGSNFSGIYFRRRSGAAPTEQKSAPQNRNGGDRHSFSPGISRGEREF